MHYFPNAANHIVREAHWKRTKSKQNINTLSLIDISSFSTRRLANQCLRSCLSEVYLRRRIKRALFVTYSLAADLAGMEFWHGLRTLYHGCCLWVLRRGVWITAFQSAVHIVKGDCGPFLHSTLSEEWDPSCLSTFESPESPLYCCRLLLLPIYYTFGCRQSLQGSIAAGWIPAGTSEVIHISFLLV
jgi:hypothetical protein